MKRSLAVFILLAIPSFLFAQTGNTVTIPEINWSFNPPANFKLLDSSENNTQVAGGLVIWRKNRVLKSLPDLKNTIACTISKGNMEEPRINMRPTETKRSYTAISRQYPNLQFDSATTTILVGGTAFEKFSMIGKKDGQIKYNHVELVKFYQGYKFHIMYNFEDAVVGAEIEKQVMDSKFGE